jgi:hypothetical protein
MSLFARQINQANSSDSPIAPHPQLKRLRPLRLIFLCAVIFMLLIIAVCTVIGSTSFADIQIPWQILPIPLIWLGFIGFSFIMERLWKSLETLRQAAAQGDDSLLAEVQPEPNTEALHIPVRIVTRLSRRGILLLGLLSSLLVIIFTGTIAQFDLWLHPLVDFSLWPVLLLMTAIVGVVMTFLCVVLWFSRRIVDIHQEGIRVKMESLGANESAFPTLFWHEARLFTCYRSLIPWNKASIINYEISSASHVIQWTWVQREKAFPFSEVPTTPFEEYQAQMRALCSLVTAKTGLPLYDLSSERARKRAQAIMVEKRSKK